VQFFWYKKDSSVGIVELPKSKVVTLRYMKTVTQQEKKTKFFFSPIRSPLRIIFSIFSWKEKKGKTYARVMMYKYTAIFSPQ
jgi:hypothetical protein